MCRQISEAESLQLLFTIFRQLGKDSTQVKLSYRSSSLSALNPIAIWRYFVVRQTSIRRQSEEGSNICAV